MNGFDTGGPIPYQLSLTFSLGQFLANIGVDAPNLTDLQAESAKNITIINLEALKKLTEHSKLKISSYYY